jgi:hypothetical protein
MAIKKPDYYKTPLRKKSDIAGYIVQNTNNRSYQRDWHPFCFNVKIPSVDCSYDHLLKIYQENYGEAKKVSREVQKEKDYESSNWEYVIERMRDDVTGSDLFKYLCGGTQIRVEYSFEGRSGGWLSINSFEGVDFNEWSWYSSQYREANLIEQDYSWLRRFYQLVVMLVHDTKESSLKNIFETYSAEYLFDPHQ